MRSNSPVSKLAKEKVLETAKLHLCFLVYHDSALDITKNDIGMNFN